MTDESQPSGQSLTVPLPVGNVTFLYTDIEGSTPLWETHPRQMRIALEVHNEAVRAAVTKYGGQPYKMIGDAFQVAFRQPADAIAAAVEAQRMLLAAPWGSLGMLRVRMGLHQGPAERKDGEYVGHTLNRVARIMSAAHGGQIVVSEELAERVWSTLPNGVTLRDLGRHRMKGMSNLEHLFQVIAPDLPAEFPRLNTLDPAPTNLPRQLTSFIGREGELASLTGLLADPRNRLVTIVAHGGMGKTRLALEVASRIYQENAQEVYFVALDRISSPAMIVQVVAEALPISLSSNEDPKTRILDYLRDKSVLLVMDNYEHVLDGAVLVQDILGAAPRTQVLATSRVKLDLLGETTFRLDGLAVEGADPEHNSAIQLFIDSARRLQPRFELTDATLPVVTHICRMIEGMPLAILLAAAWIDTLSVDEIAAEIENSIDILETEMRGVPGRQHSVRAVIEWSWRQVDASAQNLLMRLAVFRGGFTRVAAQQAAGATLRGLSQLVDKALLRRDLDNGRYYIHELLRQFAEEQLSQSAGEEQSAHTDHARYFADFMKLHETHLRDHRQREALLEIDADLDNIRIAWAYWADRQSASRVADFISALWVFFEVRGSYAPAIALYGDAARKFTRSQPDTVCAAAELQAHQAWFTALIGMPNEGLALAQQSVETLKRYAQDISVETLCGVNINAIFLNRNEVVVATGEEMLASAERSGGDWQRGWALIWWSYALLMKQEIGQAIQSAEESLAIFERLRNPFGWSVASGIILGSISMAIGDITAAKDYFLRGLDAAKEIDYLRLLQISYDNLGTIALLEKDVDAAEQNFFNSLRISHQCGQTREMLASLRDFASVYMGRGDLVNALQLLSVVLSHPVSEQNSLNRPERLRDEAEKLRVQIEAQLDPARYQTAWETGCRRQIGELVEQILN